MEKYLLFVFNVFATLSTALIACSVNDASASFATGMTILTVLSALNFYSNFKDIFNE